MLVIVYNKKNKNKINLIILSIFFICPFDFYQRNNLYFFRV